MIDYEFDPYNENPSNNLVEEYGLPSKINLSHTIIPKNAPFFLKGVVVEGMVMLGTYQELKEGIDYTLGMLFGVATRAIGEIVYGSVIIHNEYLIDTVRISYRTIGSSWRLSDTERNYLSTNVYKRRATSWEKAVGSFLPIPKFEEKDKDDITSALAIQPKLAEIADIFDRANFVDRLFPSTEQNPFMLWVAREVGDLSNDGVITKEDVDLWLGVYKEPMVDPLPITINAFTGENITIPIVVEGNGGGETDAVLLSVNSPNATLSGNNIIFSTGSQVQNYIVSYTIGGLLNKTKDGIVNIIVNPALL